MSELSEQATRLRTYAQAEAIVRGYKMGDGGSVLVAPPGPFEGQPYYVVTFHERMLNGAGDSLYFGADEVACDLLDVDDTDRAAFELKADTVSIALWYSEQGFVSLEELNAADVERLIEQDAQESNGEEE